MSGINFGDIGKILTGVGHGVNLGGLEHGAEAGFKYVIQFFRLDVWAERTNNEAAKTRLTHIKALFLREISDEAGNPLQTGLGAVLSIVTGGSHDPTAPSRHELQAELTKDKAASDEWWARTKGVG